jgi:hypothetical protein
MGYGVRPRLVVKWLEGDIETTGMDELWPPTGYFNLPIF